LGFSLVIRALYLKIMELAHLYLPIAITAIFTGLFIYALIQIVKVGYYFQKATNNTAEINASQKTGLTFFAPSRFNAIGQAHIIKVKQHFRRLVYTVAPVILFIIVVYFIKLSAN